MIAPPMGGSFGAKTFVRLEALVAALARKAGRPVKAVLDRAEEFVTLNRHPAIVRVRLGARRDGTLVAKEVDCWVDTGAYADCGPGVATKMGYAGVGPYRIPHVRVDSLAIYTNLPPNGAYRGYGAMQSVWASERTMDLLAARAGHEPARAAAHEPAARRRRVRHRRGHARRALRGLPAGGRRRRRLRGRPARQGPVRAAQGHADAEPRGDLGRAHAGRLHRAQRVVRDGPGRAPVDPADGRRAARLRAGPGRDPRPRHRHVAVRHAHDVEPLDLHDGPGAARGRQGPASATATARLRRGPQRGRARSRHRPGHRLDALAPGRRRRARERRRGDRAADRRARPRRRLRRQGRQPRRRRAAERGLDAHGPRARRCSRPSSSPTARSPTRTSPTTTCPRSATCRSSRTS